MTNPDEGGRRPDIFTSQLRSFDEMVADFRSLYGSFTAKEQSDCRAWLERVQTISAEGDPWCSSLLVKTECDEFDEAGNTLRSADAGFSPTTMLAAVRAWDAGEDFAPPSVLP